jgi:hypothetical protein
MARASDLLAPLLPLIGEWESDADTPMGRTRCSRRFALGVGGAFIELTARWSFASGGEYEERAFLGPTREGPLGVWSFTSDGGHAIGSAVELADVHPGAIGFISAMPAGRARQAYWIESDGTLRWMVEAETPKGWERMTNHSYQRRS